VRLAGTIADSALARRFQAYLRTLEIDAVVREEGNPDSSASGSSPLTGIWVVEEDALGAARTALAQEDPAFISLGVGYFDIYHQDDSAVDFRVEYRGENNELVTEQVPVKGEMPESAPRFIGRIIWSPDPRQVPPFEMRFALEGATNVDEAFERFGPAAHAAINEWKSRNVRQMLASGGQGSPDLGKLMKRNGG